MQQLQLCELLKIASYLGSVTYCIGSLIFLVLLIKIKVKKITLYILYTILHFLLSMFLSIFIWLLWEIDIDIMFSIFMLPACIAEFIITLAMYYWIKCKYR